MRFKAQLLAHDAHTVSVAFLCWDDAGIDQVFIKDRFGALLLGDTPEKPTQQLEVRVQGVGRFRTPLFAEARNTKGERTPPEFLGPVFAPPLDTRFTGGVRLPPAAINPRDPAVHALRVRAWEAASRYQMTGRHLRWLAGAMESDRRRIRWLALRSVSVSLVFAVLAGLGTLTPTFSWAWMPLAAAPAILLMLALMDLTRLVKRRGGIRAARSALAGFRSEWSDTADPLNALGVEVPPLLEGESSSCGCGGGQK